MTLDAFFKGWEESKLIFDALQDVVAALGPVETRITKSQIAFCLNRPFAWAWIPDKHLHGKHAPLVLSVTFPHRDRSQRWKEIVEPAPGRFMHHLELHSVSDIDDEVRQWLEEAWRRCIEG